MAAGSIFGTNGLWVIPLTPDHMDCDGPPILLPTSPGDAIDFAGSIVVAPPTSQIVSTQAPGLFIRQTSDTVIVYWNTNYIGYTLASAAQLPIFNWVPIYGPYYLNGNDFEYQEARSNLLAEKFFRLHYTGAIIISQVSTQAVGLAPQAHALPWSSAVSAGLPSATENAITLTNATH